MEKIVKFFIGLTLFLWLMTSFRCVIYYMDNKDLKAQINKLDIYARQLEEDKIAINKKLSQIQGYVNFAQSGMSADVVEIVSPQSKNIFLQNNIFEEEVYRNLENNFNQKYSLLMAKLKLPSLEQENVKELLISREKIINSSGVGHFSSEQDIQLFIKNQQSALADIDKNMSSILSKDDFNTYDLLKDSSYEQFQMNNFYSQLGEGVNVSEEVQTELLLSKLEQKKVFFYELEGLSRDIKNSSSEEKQYFIDQAHKTLHNYKDEYLRNARLTLTDVQFSELREFEKKHFDEMWESLAAGWGVQ